MKINITLSLDEDVVYWLKEKTNYSKLANDIILEYIEGEQGQNIQKLSANLAKIKQNIKIERRKASEIDKKIKKIKEKESKILKLVTGIDKNALSLMMECSSSAVLKAHYQANRPSDPRAYGLQKHPWLKVKQAYEEMKGGGK